MAKNYATTSSRNKACFFRCDYSYAVNHKCLDCKFCYGKLSNEPRLKVRSAGLIEIENEWNRHLYKVPVTISRYCEPFLNSTFKKNSMRVISNILENGGQVIIRTAKVGLNKDDLAYLAKFKDNVQIQIRVNFSARTNISRSLKQGLSPNTDGFVELYEMAGDAIHTHGIDVAVCFDPLIIGLNEKDAIDSIGYMYFLGRKPFIIRQLFATPYFKNYLYTLGSSSVKCLDVKVGEYYTYSNEVLLKQIEPILEAAADRDVSLSFCCNRQMNEVLGYNNNCCQFLNARSVYDRSKVLKETRIIQGITDVI